MRLTAPMIALLLLACGEPDPPKQCLSQWYEAVVTRDGKRCWMCPMPPVAESCAEVCFPCEEPAD